MNPAEYLRTADPVLARIDLDHPFRRSRRTDPYLDLLSAIMAQQLSVQAADTIFARFLALFPRRYPSPRRLAAMTDAHLRGAGVSRQKAGYARNVAAFALARGFETRRLARMSDEEIVAHFTRIKGVGRWTVEMLLMFSLGRPDVFPADDLGIQMAMKKLYRLRGSGPALRRRMTRIAEAWRPHRTHACRCLWAWRRTAG